MEEIIDGNFVEIADTAGSEAPQEQVPATRPFMSVLIPAYNCRNEIERLLDSIVIQGWDKDRLEVIICEDRNSTDNFMELVTPYYDKLNIKYYQTEERDIHCPGNTRKDALTHATGEWVTFIDNDDAFDEGAFDMVARHIAKTGEHRMVFTIFHEWIDDKYIDKSQNPNATGGYGRTFDGNTWLHGNWYNLDWLIEKNIHFKENLESHEDLYFNSLCMTALLGENAQYSIPEENLRGQQFAYTWIYRPNSLSRSYFSEKHYYIEVYLRDYIYSATEPWFYGVKQYCSDPKKPNPELKEFFLKQCIATLLYSFFYWEAGYYRIGDEVLPENIPFIKDLVDQICFRFKISKSEIINRVYSRPDEYMRIKQESFSGGGSFVELHTFKDFILMI